MNVGKSFCCIIKIFCRFKLYTQRLYLRTFMALNKRTRILKISNCYQFSELQHIKKISFFKKETCTTSLCIKSTHIGSLFWLTSQSVGINKFHQLSSQFAKKWATQFWAFLPFLRNIKFFSNNSLEYESKCLINWFNMIWWRNKP